MYLRMEHDLLKTTRSCDTAFEIYNRKQKLKEITVHICIFELLIRFINI